MLPSEFRKKELFLRSMIVIIFQTDWCTKNVIWLSILQSSSHHDKTV